MTGEAERQRQLYGAGRAARLQALELRDVLQASSVLRDGEYNLTRRQQGWNTSFNTDFPGQKLDRSHTIAAISQVQHHFNLGNDSGDKVPGSIYTKTTTRDDYGKKDAAKATVFKEDRTVNWPDMAPQYMAGNNMGHSEYSNSFMHQKRSSSAPTFPKVDTAKMKLPLDPVRFHHQRGSRFTFGTDEHSHVSEQQRAYGRVNGQEDLTHKLPRDLKSDVGKMMKDADNKSNVFRSGDYDNIAGIMESTTVSDYGPRTRDPGSLFASQLLQQKMPGSGQKGRSTTVRPTTDIPNQLTSYARSVTVPEVFNDAEEGKTYQNTAHFKFGFDPNQKASLYGKDFALAAMAKRAVPFQHTTPDAGKLFQHDPQYRGKATSLKSTDYMKPPPQVKSGILQDNIQKMSGNNVVMTCDPSRHTHDRQASMSHTDYVGPPAGYRPLAPEGERAVPYPFLHTHPALPYPAPQAQSEASNNFAGALSDGVFALDRVRTRKDMCKERQTETKKTHFTVGYQEPEFESVSSLSYMGKKKNDSNLKPAGKSETKTESEFAHLSHSGNTQDLRAADPHETSTMEGLHARHNHLPPPPEHTFRASVMKSDYAPGQRLTSDQTRSVQKYEALLSKPFAASHFFHTDNTGRNNYVSTTMDDFIKPETMSGGRKMLVAK
ncbi:uncharacterized protein LOC143296248 [Babylonia areolata]|uniref:uncharacterized protein LOC143296248 n=1 Tax=Babylonia areolata TaxID=304850 RepID=UPI003FD46081